MLSMLRRLGRRRQPLDFAMIKGGTTPEAHDFARGWGSRYISDGTDQQTQALASFFVEYHQGLLGVPDMRGFIEPDATDANLQALKWARDATGKTKVLCTNVSHSSIAKAADTLGLKVVTVDAKPELSYQVSEEELARAVSKHGRDIAVVVSTYGTTELGHIENLGEQDLVKQLQEDGAWLHVDAAYGGYVGTLSRHIRKSIPDADTITVDPYKFVGQQGCALVLVDKEKAKTGDVRFYVQSPYTLRTSLQAGPVAAWKQTVNDVTLDRLADDYVKLAQRAAQELKRQGVPLVVDPQMSIVPVQFGSREEAEYVHGALLERGYRVGKISITGQDYETHGVRIVITPKVPPDWMFERTMRLCGEIAKVYGGR